MTTTPSTTSKAAPDEQFDDLTQQRQADLMGMWIFLATELMLFGGIFTGFTVYRFAYPEVFAEAATHLDLRLGTLNTALLVTSSLFMALAERAANAERRRLTLIFLIVTISIGVVFLGIKGYEWHHEYTENLMPILGLEFEYPGAHPDRAEMFFNFYYVLTGLHAVHMSIGLGMLSVLVVFTLRWRDPPRLGRQIQMNGLYWAFVDVVWVFIFTTLYLLRA
ncbi:cytochrome c oxidase subunit 3 [Halomonas sp. McH1-25]|uniref:cytochrome c oxidase subunit 3 n=1 Tax=unclassified Halomonas TaxID=2609666 RepID=UPI001EF42BBC|nr:MULTISPECIES: cytochrome c oxidase subunit 3 [unclassified Halomonas]MCG7601945.1 cytochrome c oxidase subunit 3 [Halomonas sp. McH1-25]MCP1341614.1 cytochrome c oxidase subunit 3 [Halomonas sp. FL8]MCP1361869.1 cytochrome c oxidase subunit 3 [Halomonas sp. BBD45]MCP1365072.1 cytochrome c oxidase subunit 3 [Halomonas sp. BBD48]